MFRSTQLSEEQLGDKMSLHQIVYCTEILHNVLGENKRRKKTVALPPPSKR